jgi:FG-GAP repeat
LRFASRGLRRCPSWPSRCSPPPAQARFTQQQEKLVGSGAVGNARQGYSVALSADGNTAIVGGPLDNGSAGAAWVYVRIDGVWTQQGGKLAGSGGSGPFVSQGWSVAMSADGNTTIVGGVFDNGNIGAAWAFTRDGNGAWTQQANKLVGTGAAGNAGQGRSVALSADGNTAIVGGSNDNGGVGATWVFTRDGNGVWTQQGNKLVGSGAVGPAAVQGVSVALSADGNTALVGGPGDNGNPNSVGAVWVFTRDGNGVWTQQGAKLIGSGAVGPALQGQSVALSADGNMALVGGPGDNNFAGAAWVFTHDNNGVWSQQGAKLVGAGAVGGAQQGISVALSGDGSTALVGGWQDNGNPNGAGAAWVFRRSGAGV